MAGRILPATVIVLLLVVGYSLPAPGPASSIGAVSTGLTGKGVDAPLPISGVGTVALGPGAALGGEQQDLIRGYMDEYYRSLIDLRVYYPDRFIAPGAIAQAVADRAVWEITVAVRAMQSQDLRLDWYSYAMVCVDVAEQEDGEVVVLCSETNTQNFRQYPGVDAESRNVRHRFTLTTIDGQWLIKEHQGGGTVTDLVLRSFNDMMDVDLLQAMIVAPATRDLIVADAVANAAQRAAGGIPAPSAIQPVDHVYDRHAAVTYASQWSFGRNPLWPIYDEWGGNCNNFASQCMLAGGIPMDHQGKDQWKWYGERWDRSETPAGRSDSWASVNAFHKYAAANRGHGMVAQVDADLHSGEPGDLLQLGFLGIWRHSVLITEVIRDQAGKIVDYLVSSNTTDQRHFPVSAYLYTMQRLIKIHGWID